MDIMFDYIGFLCGLVLALGLFFLGRRLMLWYWRVDEIVDRLDSMSAALDRIAKATGKAAAHQASAAKDAPVAAPRKAGPRVNESVECPECKSIIMLDVLTPGAKVKCDQCGEVFVLN